MSGQSQDQSLLTLCRSTDFVGCRRAVITFRSIAVEAHANGEHEVAYEGHKEALDLPDARVENVDSTLWLAL